MIYLLIPIVLLLGAFGRRVAGGVLNQLFVVPGWNPSPVMQSLLGASETRVMGDTPARLIYGATIALAGLLGGMGMVTSLLMIPAVFIGTTTGNFNSMAMGRAQTSFLHDFFGMSAHAFLSAIAPVLLVMAPSLVLVCFGAPLGFLIHGPAWYWFYALCMYAAPLYELGWIISGRVGKMTLPFGLRGGAEIGEALWGAACALGAFLIFAA